MSRNVLLYSLLFMLTIVWVSLPFSPLFALSSDDYFRVKVVDAETGRGVPLVKLRTANDIRFYTDSAGVAAIHEPGLMGKEVWFEVDSHGYEFSGPAYREGIIVDLEPGGSRTLSIERQNIAERLYRVTGPGIYRDSVLLGETTPIESPVLNAHVKGQDSVVSVVYKGKLYWFWGDTGILDERLGVFRSTGATSTLPSRGGLDPNRGVNLNYFTSENNEARRVFAKSVGSIPIFPGSVMVLQDSQSEQRMFSIFAAGEPRRGLAEWNDQKGLFEKMRSFPEDMKVKTCSNVSRVQVEGRDWFYFSCPYPIVRVPATVQALQDTSQFETFTPFEPGSKFQADPQPEIERDTAGNPVWGWKKNTFSLHTFRRRLLLKAFDGLKMSEDMFYTRNVNDTRSVTAHRGTVYWNEYRKKWIMIFNEAFGEFSFLGDLWYAEADSPLGPWVYSRRIVRHDYRDCYNVKQHRMLDQKEGRSLYFECTYAARFSKSSPTYLYNYNQVMYRLNLTDTRLHLPSPVYHFEGTVEGEDVDRYHTMRGLRNLGSVNADSTARGGSVPFYALPSDRSQTEAVPVWENVTTANTTGDSIVELTLTKPASAVSDSPTFYAFPPEFSNGNRPLVTVYEYRNDSTGQLIYSPEEFAPSGWVQTGAIFKAWESPNVNPPREPGVRPHKECMGAAAVCD